MRAGVAALIVVAAMFAVVATDGPVTAQVRSLTCAIEPSADGFVVTWRDTTDHGADRYVIERSVTRRDGTSPWWWRGRVEPAGGPDPVVASGRFVDGRAPADAVAVAHRVVAKLDGVEVEVADCGPAGFGCVVSVVDGGYRIDWAGGPEGAGVDHVIARDVNPDDVYHWRGRVDTGPFLDTAAPTIPEYRVTARLDRATVAVADCRADGPMAGIRPGADMVCPVPGATFTNTWLAPRDGGARRHQGVDMFADRDAPVLAPEGGALVFFTNRLGGLSFGLQGDSGRWYYGAHLQRWVGEDRRVEAGELIAMVGTTGNARHTPPHLHFEIHPGGRGTPAVDPTPTTRAACR